MLPKKYTQGAGNEARIEALPWRIPATVPCAELRRAVEIMMPIYRTGILDLRNREAYRITHDLFLKHLSRPEHRMIMKWCHIPYKNLRNKLDHHAREIEMKELQILFGLALEAKVNITRELRALYRNSYDDRLPGLTNLQYPSWTTEEVGVIWNVYSADRTNEKMYDTMHAALGGVRTHRSIMRMLEFIVYCEKNPGIENPNMIDAFTIAPIPDAVAPDNPMNDGEMKTFLELRSYYGPQDDWNGLVANMIIHAQEFGHRNRQVAEVKELYIRQGLDYLEADKWTLFEDKHVHQLVDNPLGTNWYQISSDINRTPHATMERYNYLTNHPDWDNETGTWNDDSGAGPSNA